MNTIRVDRNFINDTYFSQLDYPTCLSSRVLTLVLLTPKSNLMRMSLMYNSCANIIVNIQKNTANVRKVEVICEQRGVFMLM